MTNTERVRAALDEALADIADPSFFESAIEALIDMVKEVEDEGTEVDDDITPAMLHGTRVKLVEAWDLAKRYREEFWDEHRPTDAASIVDAYENSR